MIENTDDFRKLVRGHIVVALSVLLLTGLAVTVHFLDIDPKSAMVLVLAVAGIQVFLILQFLMHLVEERFAITALIGVTIVFLAALVGLTVYTYHDTYEGAHHTGQTATVAPAPVER